MTRTGAGVFTWRPAWPRLCATSAQRITDLSDQHASAAAVKGKPLSSLKTLGAAEYLE